jgi:hypothetical protein
MPQCDPERHQDHDHRESLDRAARERGRDVGRAEPRAVEHAQAPDGGHAYPSLGCGDPHRGEDDGALQDAGGDADQHVAADHRVAVVAAHEPRRRDQELRPAAPHERLQRQVEHEGDRAPEQGLAQDAPQQFELVHAGRVVVHAEEAGQQLDDEDHSGDAQRAAAVAAAETEIAPRQ